MMSAQTDLVRLFSNCAELASTVQRRIIEIDNKPARAKVLRRFSTREAADLLSISDGYLRRLALEDDGIPKGLVAAQGRRFFSLEEINTVRSLLHERTGDNRYLAGRDRRKGDALQVVTFCNFKGGAAKTTTAVHFAQYLALRGCRVLLIDLDSQASATGLFGFVPDDDFEEEDTLYGFLRGTVDGLQPLVRQTYFPSLDLLPANLGLYRAEFELPVRQLRERDFRFWRLLADGLPSLDDGYDVVLCDCPPSLGYLTINALFAADGLIVPAPASMLDFASTGRFFQMLADTLGHIAEFEGRTAKTLDFVRILVAKYHTNDRNQQRVAAWMTSTFGDHVLDARMAHTTALDQAGTVKRTLYEMEQGTGRRTQERGLDYLNAVNAELHALLLACWGRTRLLAAQEG
jgi:chromosome partitioning protein